MKKTFLTFVLFTVFATVQAQPPQKRERPNFTAEQKTELAIKKLTLDLDLTAKQQNEIKPLISKQIQEREAAMAKRKEMKDAEKKPTKDELFAMANQKMDAQIAFKNSMKSILNTEQFEKFEKMQQAKMKRGKEGKREKRPKNK